jgi:hypothetical protein
MLIPLLAVTTAAVVCFILYQVLFSPLISLHRRKKRLLREGIEADAILLNMEEAGVFLNRQAVMILQVKVHPQNGRNFVSEIREVMTGQERSHLHTGSTLRVRYNPSNIKDVMVVH